MKRALSTLAIICALALPAYADEPALTLDAAIAQARAHAPERVVADARVKGAEAVAAAAGQRLRDPVASASYTGGGDRAWSIGIEWAFALSGARTPRRAAARATLAARTSERNAAFAALDADVALAFAELADAQRRVARADRLVELHTLAVDVATRLLDAGGGTQIDIDGAALDLRRARAERAVARGDLAGARVRLGRLLGRDDGESLTVVDEVSLGSLPSEVDVDARVARDPRVVAAVAEADAARATADAERRGARPDITFGIEFGKTDNDIPRGAFASDPTLVGAWSEREVAFQLSVPLPLFERNRAARAQARADLFFADANLVLVRADVRAEIEEALAALTAAVEAVEAVADVPTIVERELGLLDKALRSGAIELQDWSQQARRLEEAGATYDEAVLALRRARAAWARSAAP